MPCHSRLYACQYVAYGLYMGSIVLPGCLSIPRSLTTPNSRPVTIAPRDKALAQRTSARACPLMHTVNQNLFAAITMTLIYTWNNKQRQATRKAKRLNELAAEYELNVSNIR